MNLQAGGCTNVVRYSRGIEICDPQCENRVAPCSMPEINVDWWFSNLIFKFHVEFKGCIASQALFNIPIVPLTCAPTQLFRVWHSEAMYVMQMMFVGPKADTLHPDR